MAEDEVRAPKCPGCDQEPHIMLSSGQFFCGNDDCLVIMWNAFDAPETFKARAQRIDLSFLGRGEP